MASDWLLVTWGRQHSVQVMVNMLYVPFGALMLVMYDKAMLRTIDTHYNNKDNGR